jgi:hypothetical protein
MSQKPGPSPAHPALSHDDYVLILRELRKLPDRSEENRAVAHKIDAYLLMRRHWANDAAARKLEIER